MSDLQHVRVVKQGFTDYFQLRVHQQGYLVWRIKLPMHLLRALRMHRILDGKTGELSAEISVSKWPTKTWTRAISGDLDGTFLIGK